MNLQLRQKLLLLGDIILLYLSLLATVLLGFWGSFSWDIFFTHLLPFTILYLFWVATLYSFGLYELNLIKPRLDFYPRILGALTVITLIGVIFFYLFPFFGVTPKTNLILNVLIFGTLAVGWRKLFYSLFSSYFLNKVAVVEESSWAKELEKEIMNRPYLGYQLVPINLNQDLFYQIQEKKIDTLIITTNLQSNPQLLQSLYRCLPAKINFLDLAQVYETITKKIPVSFISQVWFLENLKEGERGFYDKISVFVDLVLALFLFILTSPLWLLVALFIKLEDGGPIFYTQKRIGKDRKPFSLIKFRSMKERAEENGAVWAEKDDPRTTKIGRILRRLHLDELPQIINILREDISLVGPRPERPEFIQKLEKKIPHYHLRHLIKPGFTGWAQIKFRYGRSVMDSQEKFQYDLYYIKNRSLLLDLGILLKTFRLFFRKG